MDDLKIPIFVTAFHMDLEGVRHCIVVALA